MLLHLVIIEQHLLANVTMVELVRMNIRILHLHLARDIVLLADNCCPGVQLLEVVLDRVLNVHVGIGEYILGHSLILYSCEVGVPSDSMNNIISAF